jgi:Fic family protein
MYVAKPPPPLSEVAAMDAKRMVRIIRAVEDRKTTNRPGYPHWDKVRHLKPPAELTAEDWWYAIKMSRASGLRPLPLTDPEGRHFTWGMPDDVLRLLHFVDQHSSGEIAMPEVVTADEQARQHYLVTSLMEEAIRSSQLEGASTTRPVAKELLRTGRPPKDRSERMIVNNYRAIQFMREVEELTPEIVLELQRVLTEHTLEDPTAAGRLQTRDDVRVGVYDNVDGSLIHDPPPADQLEERLERLCEFANNTENPDDFVHPVIRAILIHFWLAYDHPFEDGNGRTARALFYWSMRTQGYWLTDYLTISGTLREAPSKYSRSFVLTETDDLDTTYFILYQLQIINRAIEALHVYLERKVQEVREVERILKGDGGLNHRQLALLGDAIRNSDHVYTFKSHAGSHHVTHETARSDLQQLHERRLLDRQQIGQRYTFSPARDLTRRARPRRRKPAAARKKKPAMSSG